MTTAFARNSDPLTSLDAADRVPVHTLEALVLRHLCWAYPNGLTSYQVAEASGISLVTLSPRFKPLEQKGLIERTKQRDQGRIVWRAMMGQGRLF
jgi:predicted transcriptional regulator